MTSGESSQGETKRGKKGDLISRIEKSNSPPCHEANARASRACISNSLDWYQVKLMVYLVWTCSLLGFLGLFFCQVPINGLRTRAYKVAVTPQYTNLGQKYLHIAQSRPRIAGLGILFVSFPSPPRLSADSSATTLVLGKARLFGTSFMTAHATSNCQIISWRRM